MTDEVVRIWLDACWRDKTKTAALRSGDESFWPASLSKRQRAMVRDQVSLFRGMRAEALLKLPVN